MNYIGDTIGWADFSWNPVEGCSAVSEGCEHCYAAAMARRFHRHWGGPVVRQDRMYEPAKRRKGAWIFCCSTSDLFQREVGQSVTAQVLHTMAQCPQHQFVVLTKRIDEAKHVIERLRRDAVTPGGWPMMLQGLEENLILGVTAENQARWDERVPMLLRTWRGRTAVSVEPMLGPVSLRDYGSRLKGVEQKVNLPDWVICGPETGPGAREFDPAWLERLETECQAWGVAFWDKRLGRAGNLLSVGKVNGRPLD